MRAATYAHAGDLDVIEIREVPNAEPGASDVLIEVAYAGLNRADILERQGRYDPPEAVPGPAIPGLEYAGLVVSTGARVRGFTRGDRVFGIVSGRAHAELVVADAGTVMHVPPNLALEDAAAIPEAFMTAWDALQRGGFYLGASVLVHAAGSAVALAAAALITEGGGRAVGTTRSPAKALRAREFGFSQCYLLDDDWVTATRGLTGERGIDIVLDFIGPAVFERNVAALAPGGRIVQIGMLGGTKGTISFAGLMARRATLIGTTLRARPLHEKVALARAFEAAVVPLFARGALAPIVDRVVDLAHLRDAHAAMEADDNFGKIVLKIH